MANKKNYKCQKTSTASKLMIFSPVLDYILSLQALFFEAICSFPSHTKPERSESEKLYCEKCYLTGNYCFCALCVSVFTLVHSDEVYYILR